MKKFILITSFIVSCHAKAQDYRIIYKMSYRPDSTSSSTYHKNMILDVNENIIKFHSLRMYERDSLYEKQRNSLAGESRFMDYDHTIVKNKNTKEVSRFYRLNFGGIFKTTEAMPQLNWEITDEVKKINDFNCQKATLKYKGRMWEAWFTTSIPLQNGPYVFDGLPGLIVALKDSKENYSFEFLALKKFKAMDYLKTDFIAISRQQLKNLYLNYYDDPFKDLRTHGVQAKIENGNGSDTTVNFSRMTLKVRADLKRFNNPIELMDIIHYPN